MPTTDAQALAEQLLLGRYRVLETRGEGGFGTVYVCWDPRLMRRVAIKSIRLKPQAPQGSLVEGVPRLTRHAPPACCPTPTSSR